jgi:uncharacterized membrane protein HdeD (DUF308 family)
MAENEPSRPPWDPLFGDAVKNWGWLVGLGIASILLGTIGLGMTFTLTLAGVLLFGVLLGVAGVLQLVDAFQCRGWKGTLLHVLIGLVYVAAALVAVADPVGAAVALTLVLGAALVVVGILRAAMAFQHRGSRGWGWALAGGLLSALLGVLVMAQWPVSGFWVIGLFIALELILNGWAYLFFGLTARRAGRAAGGGESSAPGPA